MINDGLRISSPFIKSAKMQIIRINTAFREI